jgi:hypothetical protein
MFAFSNFRLSLSSSTSFVVSITLTTTFLPPIVSFVLLPKIACFVCLPLNIKLSILEWSRLYFSMLFFKRVNSGLFPVDDLISFVTFCSNSRIGVGYEVLKNSRSPAIICFKTFASSFMLSFLNRLSTNIKFFVFSSLKCLFRSFCSIIYLGMFLIYWNLHYHYLST